MSEVRPAPEQQAQECPHCHSDDIVVDKLGFLYCATCFSCGMRGPRLSERDEAINAWNALPRRPDIERVEQERDWLAVNLANGLVDPGCIEHLAELGGMSPPDPATLIEAAKEATCSRN